METNQTTNTQKTTPGANIGNKLIIVSVAVLLAGVAIGYGLSFFIGSEPGTNEQHELLKQAVREQYPEYFETGEFGTFYSGTVQEVNENSIIVEVNIPEIVLLASDLNKERELVIDENTRIIKNIQKNDEQYAQEISEYEVAYDEYLRRIEGLSDDVVFSADFEIQEPAYPDFEAREEIKISEVKAGNLISVSVQQEGLAEDGGETITVISITENIMEDVIEDEFTEEAI